VIPIGGKVKKFYFFAADLDEADSRDDARAFIQSCEELGVPAALEISRSGNGAHAWVFFGNRVSARDARRLGTAIISHPPLDTLVLAMPVSWKGTLQQYAGRLHREHASKTDVRIIDFVEMGHPALLRMWDKRQRGYRAMGYRVGSDVPAE
jgi:hypothetical protein